MTGGELDYRARLTAFYAKYVPQKLHTVDGTLALCRGEEEDLLERLVRQYGPEPESSESEPSESPDQETVARGGDYRNRLTAFYEKYAPRKVHTVDGTLALCHGEEEELFERLVRQYGPEPEESK